MATYISINIKNNLINLIVIIILVNYSASNGYFPRDCGKCPIKAGGSCVEVQSRIVGGREATRGSFPWQVLVEHAEGGNCGGAIVNKEWVITTAHCFYTRNNPNDPSKYVITAGEWDRLSVEGTEQRFNGSFVHRHPQFVRSGDINDVALIRINGTFTFNNYVQPVCFPTATLYVIDPSFDGSYLCVVSGWGTFEPGAKYNGSSSQFLKYEKAPLWNTTVCNSTASHYAGKIYAGMVCAGFRKTGAEDAKKCQVVGYGDSGGPLSCRDKATRQWTVVGITSWGERCEQQSYTPTVYSSISYYNPYVKQVLQAHSVALKKEAQERQKRVVLHSRGNLRTAHAQHHDDFFDLEDRNYHVRQEQDDFHRQLKDKIKEQRRNPPTNHNDNQYLHYYDYDKGYDYSGSDSNKSEK